MIVVSVAVIPPLSVVPIEEISYDNGKTWKLSKMRGSEWLDIYHQTRIDKGWAKKMTSDQYAQSFTQPTETPTAVPVVDKVADIEKVGINNLLVSGIVTNPTTIEKGKQYLLVTYTGYTGNASTFEVVTATGNKKEESVVSSGSGVSKNLVDTFINSKGQEVTTGGLNKKIVELPTININDKKQVLTFLLNQAKNKKLLSAPKGSKLGLQEITEDKTKVKLHFLNSDFTKGETWINYNASNRDYETKFINCTIQNFDVDDKCCQHDLDPDCDCCNAVCPDCQDDDYYLARRDK